MRGTFAYLFLPCCPMKDIPSQSYRQACLRLLFSLLVIWFIVSFGCGILFREWLDANADVLCLVLTNAFVVPTISAHTQDGQAPYHG